MRQGKTILVTSTCLILVFVVIACGGQSPTPKTAEPTLGMTPTTTPSSTQPSETTTSMTSSIPNLHVQVTFEFSQVDSQQRAVAFHSISFLDADGYVIDELVFG